MERDGTESHYGMENYPPTLAQKVEQLEHSRSHMTEHMAKAGEAILRRVGDEMTRLTYVRRCFGTSRAAVILLSNDTIQV